MRLTCTIHLEVIAVVITHPFLRHLRDHAFLSTHAPSLSLLTAQPPAHTREPQSREPHLKRHQRRAQRDHD